MGVQGLWQLVHAAGKPVSPSSLEGKVLAVDVSIWLHQTMKGMRDKDGNPLPNAHLQGLFSRVCKLLFYRIRPVFVFDGGVPALKKQTIAIRRERKEAAEQQKGLVTRKILENLLRSHAVSGLTGDRTDRLDLPSKRRAELDLFELPPLPEADDRSADPAETASLWEGDSDLGEEHRDMVQSFWGDLQNLDEINADAEEFQSLPPEIRHELLSEMKEQRRETALARINIMPEDSKDFSNYQLQKLIKQSRLSGQIESVRKEMNRRVSGDITYALGDNYYGEEVEANRVVSEDAAHYVLIKGLTRKQQMAQAERCKERRLSREKRELEQNSDQILTSDAERENRDMESRETESRGTENRDMESRETESRGMESRDTESRHTESGDTFSDQDEVEVTIKGRKRANRRILSDDDDDEMSDESDKKRSRRERRGKSLVTRKGVRNVSKGRGRSAKSATRHLTAIDEEEEGVWSETAVEDPINPSIVPHAEALSMGKDDAAIRNSIKPEENDEDLHGSRSSSPVPVKTSPVSADSSVNAFPNPGAASPILGTDSVKGETAEQGDTQRSLTATEDRDRRNKGRARHNHSDWNEAEERAQDAEPSHNSIDVHPKLNRGTRHEPRLAAEQDTEITEMSLRHTSLSAERDSTFTETQNRLLREEEDLNKAKEDKMAALLKSLEKRKQVVESAPEELSPDEEDLSLQERQEMLLKQEQELMKEKENKMAALLLTVEKRTSLQALPSIPVSESSDLASDLPSEKVRKGSRRKQAKSGFLEDVADLERRTVQKKVKSRLTEQTASPEQTSSTPSISQAVPALTVDYLEDVESMAELDTKERKDIDTNDDALTHNRKTSDKDMFQKDRSSLTSSPNCRALSEESRGKSTDRKPAAEENVLSHGPEKRQTKPEVFEAQEKCVEGFQVQEADVTLEASRAQTAGGDGSGQKSEGSSMQHPQPLEEEEDSEDEGFIEITIHPSKVPDDDLFPASIFATEPAHDNKAFPSGASEVQTTGITPLNIRIDSNDDVEEITEPSLQQEEGKIQDGDMLEQKVVGEAHRNSTNAEEIEGAFVGVSSFHVEDGEGAQGRRSSVESAKDEEACSFSRGVASLPDLYGLQRDLSTERKTLTLERGRQARLGKSVTEQVNLEAQELLQLFGVPYVVSPMEAEAQCACLELSGLTQGTVTDDSDAWLFGASHVYKNFFNNTKYVEFYSADALHHSFGLDRRRLINVALLCGSDYTPGIPGVGPVRAMEIMAQFPGDGLEGLTDFREWWEDAQAGGLPGNQGKIRNQLRRLELHDGFPSRQVLDAYLRPEVDESEEPFSWGLPDLDLLRQYAKQKFGWAKQKADDVLEPMIRELTKKTSQGRIHSYFQPENFMPPKPVKSKRLQKALDKFQGRGSSSESESASSSDESQSSSGSESESEESRPASPEPGKGIKGKADQGVMGKANQIVSAPQSRGRGRGASRGKRGGKPGAQSSQITTAPAHGMKGAMSETGAGKSHVPKARAHGTKGVVSETGAGGISNVPRADRTLRGRGRGTEGGRGKGQQGRGRHTASLKQPRSAPRRDWLLKEEVSLSESSSSSDSESKPKKRKTEPVASAPLHQKQATFVSATQKSVAARKRTGGVAPNVKKLAPTSAKSAAVKRKHQTDSRASASTGDSTAFREAMGGDLDPTTMTLDDLGSDFSE